jgi:hypothetical protein
MRSKVGDIADFITNWAERTARVLPQLPEAWEAMYSGTAHIVSHGTVSDADDVQALIGLRSGLREFVDDEPARLDGPRGLLETIPGMKGISKEMTRATTRVERVVAEYIEQMESGQAYVTRLLNLVDDRMQGEGIAPVGP